MDKKAYLTPKSSTIDFKVNHALLIGSGDGNTPGGQNQDPIYEGPGDD